MRWHRPIRRRYLHSYCFPLARVRCDMSLRTNIRRISRDDQPLLAAINRRFLRRVRQRDLSFAGQEGYISASQGNRLATTAIPESCQPDVGEPLLHDRRVVQTSVKFRGYDRIARVSGRTQLRECGAGGAGLS